VEADRCYFCYDAPCMTACPTSIDIPMFIRKIQAGNPVGSAKTIFDQNILGGMCARVCPTESLCEEVCVRESPKASRSRSACCSAMPPTPSWSANSRIRSRAPTDRQEGRIVGAGPAGLSCAHRLACMATMSPFSRPGRNPAASTNMASPPTRRPTTFAQDEVEFILQIGGITIENGKALAATSRSTSCRRVRRRVPRSRAARRQCARA
jgi:dihydropyrimidine dehydrogenase (NAD+) subunit PreT